MEPLKHECGVALIRLLKPIEYYRHKYGTYAYGLNLLYLLMEKQHNRGQEAAGIGVVKIESEPGNEYVFRERALGSGAITEIFGKVMPQLVANDIDSWDAKRVELFAPFIGQIYMGHLRYSTTGKGGMAYVHPFLRRNNWKSRNLLLCGNFNMTNVDEIFREVIASGQHPRIYSDTVMLLEQLGNALDKENHRNYRLFRDTLQDPELSNAIENNLDMARVLESTSPLWDGGFVICGATGSGDMFTLRDRNGIRPAYYYVDDEIVVVASERPAIQTVLDVHWPQVKELAPGNALIVKKDGTIAIKEILPAGDNRRCSFERIYFSRGSDRDIYRERKALGRVLAPQILEAVGHDLQNSVFSFIPNTAEVAFIGMIEGLERYLDLHKAELIMQLQKDGRLTKERIAEVMESKLRIEKIALKDIKLRTFIAEGSARNDLAAHVYDVTYGCIVNDVDNLVVIDDSIVRGTTLQQSIIKMLDRLHPKKIVVVSSSPQVRYPDYYGIDMSRLGEFIAFRAAISLLKRTGRSHVIDSTYENCKATVGLPEGSAVNYVKAIYEHFTDEEINREIVNLLIPPATHADVQLVYQTVDNLHTIMPGSPGDWYFTGDYPTPGGNRLVNQAFINYYEGRVEQRG